MAAFFLAMKNMNKANFTDDIKNSLQNVNSVGQSVTVCEEWFHLSQAF